MLCMISCWSWTWNWRVSQLKHTHSVFFPCWSHLLSKMMGRAWHVTLEEKVDVTITRTIWECISSFCGLSHLFLAKKAHQLLCHCVAKTSCRMEQSKWKQIYILLCLYVIYMFHVFSDECIWTQVLHPPWKKPSPVSDHGSLSATTRSSTSSTKCSKVASDMGENRVTQMDRRVLLFHENLHLA